MSHDKQLRPSLLNLNSKEATKSSGQAVSQPTALTVTHKASGPRTAAGKQRSKYNARKHGIFSQEIVLKDESRSQYESLLAGLLDYFEPIGFLEEMLVEKLATLLWRQRRLLVAENAEIHRGAELIECEKVSQIQQEVEQIEQEHESAAIRSDAAPGLISRIHNPTILASCMESLVELRDGIKADGFDEEHDLEILQKIYGGSDRFRISETLLDSYWAWQRTSGVSEEEREREYASPSECVRNVLDEIDRETRRLKEFQKSQASIEASQNKLNRLRLQVPDSPALERLLRYEASLDRSFDRTLSQLERLQRMRRGQPVPPTLKVEVND
ncbi:MAG: hypothetical protein ACLP3K_08450 [Candidatus Acidiferrales bacterium]